MAWMKLFGASGFALASTAGRVGNPIAAVVVVPVVIVVAVRTVELGPDARERKRPLHHPVAEMEPERSDGLGLRKWVGRERPWAVVVAAALGDVAPVDVEAA